MIELELSESGGASLRGDCERSARGPGDEEWESREWTGPLCVGDELTVCVVIDEG